MGDIFAEEEARMAAEARAEIAREDAAWAALPQAERDRISAAREARLADLFSNQDDDASEDNDEAEDDE
jgi:hypothetical protein